MRQLGKASLRRPLSQDVRAVREIALSKCEGQEPLDGLVSVLKISAAPPH